MISDLHCHISAKAIMGLEPNIRQKAWTTYSFNSKPLVDLASGDILDSQCSLDQCRKGQAHLIFWVLHPFERGIVEAKKLIKVLDKTKGIDKDLLIDYVGENISYFEMLNKEVEILLNTDDINIILDTGLDLNNDDPQTQNYKVNIATCIEGVHSFMDVADEQGIQNPGEFLTRIDDFFKRDDLKVFYMTLTHINANGIFNHAFSGKLLKEIDLPKFLPTNINSLAISELGYQIIDKCIEHQVHPDVKHMSYRGRLSLYKKLQDLADNNKYYPAPICSHTGVVGSSQHKYYKGLKLPLATREYNEETDSDIGYESVVYKGQVYVKVQLTKSSPAYLRNFNHRSLNLYDEDIEAITSLGGLIGIVLDQRVLGKKNELLCLVSPVDALLYNDNEYLTLEDFKWMCLHGGRRDPYALLTYKNDADLLSKSKKLTDDNSPPYVFQNTQNEQADVEPAPNRKENKKHLAVFCKNIIHTLDVCATIDPAEPYKYVCLGSDLDGIINTVDNCKTFTHMPNFRNDVTAYLTKFRRKRKTFHQLYNISVGQFIEKFFHTNIIDFYKIGQRV